MKITHALIVAIFPLLVVSAEYGFAQSVVFHTDSTVYSPEDPLLVYGTVSENDPLILRLFAPDGTIKGFEQISADIDGIFNHILLTWPEPSTTFPYGTYSIEILSTTNEGILGTIDVRFGPNENDEIVISRDATALVYAPESCKACRFRTMRSVCLSRLLAMDSLSEMIQKISSPLLTYIYQMVQ